MESFFLFLFALDLAFNYAASTDKVPSPCPEGPPTHSDLKKKLSRQWPRVCVCLMSFACVFSFLKVRYLQSLHGVADVLAVVPVVFLALRPLQSVKVPDELEAPASDLDSQTILSAPAPACT